MEIKEIMIKEWPHQKDQIEEMRKTIEELHQELDSQAKELRKVHKNEEILSKLYDDIIIDREGNLL